MELIRKLKSVLEKLNLSEKEIAFYVAVLKAPKSTVYEIAKKTGFQKDGAYQMFEQLKAKGLIDVQNNGARREILPVSLKKFSQDIYAKSCRLWRYAEALKELDPVLPFLDEARKTRSLEVFNVDQFPEHWEDLSYWNWEEVIAYGNFEMLLQVEKEALPADIKFRDQRTRRGRYANPLLTPGPYTSELIKNDEREFRETRVLDIPELKDDLIVIFPSIEHVSMWSRSSDGKITGAFIHDAHMTQFHCRMHRYFKGIAQRVPT